MTPRELAIATGARIDRATEWLPHIESAMDEFYIDFPLRKIAFLAQVGHESGGLHYTTELWGPTPEQIRYERDFDLPWQQFLNGQKFRNTKPFELGNDQKGDGFKYRAHGLIQTTGKKNHERAGIALGVDLVKNPEKLALPEYAARGAGLFWRDHDLNKLADAGDFLRITKIINGGTNGLAERIALYEQGKEALA